MLTKTNAACLLPLVLLVSTTIGVGAQALPVIKVGAGNGVPQCATPGRLAAYLASRNANLDPRFAKIAVHYMRQGEELGLRWDVAFFQMIVETRSLEFRRGNGEPAAVRPTQNNFAGIGATGGGNPGETFADIATGVRAHLQHVQMYGGERVTAPVAERTRKVQDWGVLAAWHKGLNGPVTFSDLARNWAPGDRSYAASIDVVGRRFFESFCNMPDPEPHLVAEARTGRMPAVSAVAGVVADERVPTTGAALAKRAVERSRADADDTRSALGVAVEAPPQPAPVVASRPPSRPFRLLNAEPLPITIEREALPPVPSESATGPTAAPPDRHASLAPDASPQTQASTAMASLESDPAEEAIKSLVTGKTFLLETPLGSSIPIAFRADGTMSGRAGATLSSMLGASSDSGKWWVDKARLCQKWRVWFDKENQCLKLRQAGSTIHWTRDDGKSGTARISAR